MPNRRAQADNRLAELYAAVPAIPDCRGDCWFSCGPLSMSDREYQRIAQDGIRITDMANADRWGPGFWCEALDGAGRCLVYDHRPMICRLWGTTYGLACPLGCQPERWLSDEEGYELILESLAAGGSDRSGLRVSDDNIGMLMAEFRQDPAQVERFLAAGRESVMIKLKLLEREGEDGHVRLPPEIARRRRRAP